MSEIKISIFVILYTNMKRDFYKDVYTILKSDLINNMDHMRISGIEKITLMHKSSMFSLLHE